MSIKKPEVIDIREDSMVAIVDGDNVRINSLNPLNDNPFDYDSVRMTVDEIIALADKLKSSQ